MRGHGPALLPGLLRSLQAGRKQRCCSLMEGLQRLQRLLMCLVGAAGDGLLARGRRAVGRLPLWLRSRHLLLGLVWRGRLRWGRRTCADGLRPLRLHWLLLLSRCSVLKQSLDCRGCASTSALLQLLQLSLLLLLLVLLLWQLSRRRRHRMLLLLLWRLLLRRRPRGWRWQCMLLLRRLLLVWQCG